MRIVTLLPFAITEINHKRNLIIRYRVYDDGSWTKNGFWTFPLPVHEDNIFTRCYLELNANKVYTQPSMFIRPNYGTFH